MNYICTILLSVREKALISQAHQGSVKITQDERLAVQLPKFTRIAVVCREHGMAVEVDHYTFASNTTGPTEARMVKVSSSSGCRSTPRYRFSTYSAPTARATARSTRSNLVALVLYSIRVGKTSLPICLPLAHGGPRDHTRKTFRGHHKSVPVACSAFQAGTQC